MKVKKSNYSGDKAVLIEITDDDKVLKLYYSYDTLIAFRINEKLYISKNEWTRTTGRHLNSISADKDIRIPHKELEDILKWIRIF